MLFQRRQVWVPSVWGFLLLSALAAVLLGGLALGIRGFLAIDEPARGLTGRGARTLIVEGWLEEPEVVQAIERARRGHYERVLTTGGPIERWQDCGGWRNYAARAAATLEQHGLTHPPVTAIPAAATRQDRTWHSALAVRDWAAASGTELGDIDIYTAGVHARRSRMVYRMALGGRSEVGVVAVTLPGDDTERWWQSSQGAKTVMGEALSWAWTACCFWPSQADI